MEPGAKEKKNEDKLIRILFVTLVFSVMNATLFYVVLPQISEEFALAPSSLSWLVTGYLIVYAFGSAIFGKLTDKYRLKDLLTFGILFMVLGSMFGLFSSAYWMVFVGRVLQSFGASVIPAASMIISIRYYSQEYRGKALGTSAAGIALGTAVGPIVSGFLAGITGWRFLFCLPLLLLFTLPFFRKYLGDEQGHTGEIDWIGGILLAGMVIALLLALTIENWILFFTGIVLMILFILRIRSAAEPFIQPSLFRNKNYTVGIVIAFLAFSINLGIPLATPLFLTKVNELSPVVIGLVLFPAVLASALLGKRGGKLADEKGNHFLVYMAALLIFICFQLLSSFVGFSPYFIAFILIIGNVGNTFLQVAMTNNISRTLTAEQAGVGIGFFYMMNLLAGATAACVIGKILDFGTPTFRFNPIPSNVAVFGYSNVFFGFALIAVVVAILYFIQFGSASKKVQL